MLLVHAPPGSPRPVGLEIAGAPLGEDGGDGLAGAGRLEVRTSRPNLGLPSCVYGYCAAAVLPCPSWRPRAEAFRHTL